MMSRGMLMNEDLLQRAILEQEPKDKGQGIANEEGTQLDEILKLCLEFRNILRIDHLWEFTSLARLNLNNNLIENIEGLDHLINLTWLDLSFNGIELIEGLESLQKLELLNLSDNKISVLENMETLERLTHFSIANNLLGELDIVLYLRKFKNLFNINLFGNPCSKEGDYTLFIAAFFPDLKFLDYTLLDENTKKEASIKHRYVLEEMRCEELHKQKAEKAEQRKEAEAQLHTDAFVEFLNGSDLFKCMFNDDQEADKLHRKETVIEYQQKALHILANFEQQHKERTVDMRKLSDRELLKVRINQCNDEINQLCKGLMTLEFQMDITKSDTFAQCRDLEDDYNGKVRVTALALLDDASKDNVDEFLPDDVRILFTDKETVMDALATGHDNHLMKINDRETQLVSRANSWKVALIKGIQDKDLKENRMRIKDLHRYMDHLLLQLEEFQ
ncbi:Dynein regulatory complex subunit 3 [Dissostichus eleginoides]|uniref:Dynein regulatory complex subunit 3 n=1 Tax=Dissostichus eleginoides TaxID=100907 RepID=A0AAD9ETC4_DISEL|nr:Dynein regulatory complex subunit 3 [Dissostichus eleginoides]